MYYLTATPVESHFNVFQTADEWSVILIITALFYIFGGVVYWLYASGEVQSWAIRDPNGDASVQASDLEEINETVC